ncbi:flagellar hook-basal body complex protein [Allohahella sp. A8]|uniref:flagellar hook-basal body complex protein n=1 Tax=Allohahella sp. A8 TaxID=3141461 RepID=UPI003A808B86
MPFNVALTGLRAANTDLEVTGNNIANASTTGFKQSRAEFGDIYSSSFLSTGSARAGDGVRVQSISQQFSQGAISITENGLDLAIDGEGFFVLNDGGAQTFSRAGVTRVDKDGYVVNNTGARLQGFPADEDGAVGGVLSDLRVDESALAPKRTTEVQAVINLDASDDILVERGNAIATNTAIIGTPNAGPAGSPAVNGYPGQALMITQADGTTQPLFIAPNTSADAISSQLSGVRNIDSTAIAQARLTSAGYNNASGNMGILIDGVAFNGYSDLTQLGNAINASPTLVGVSAVLVGPAPTGGNPDTRDLVLTKDRGSDLNFAINGPANGDSFEIAEVPADSIQNNQALPAPVTPRTLQVGGNEVATVGGRVQLNLSGGVTIVDNTAAYNTANPPPAAQSTNNGLVSDFTGAPFVNNVFDPSEERTYNYATSSTVYDSLGNSHVLTKFFVKEAQTETSPDNLWTMYVQIDNADVGDPLVAGGAATRAAYSLVFNEDGSFNEVESDEVLISNWTPLDAEGAPNGAVGPINVINGGVLPIPTPPNSSNFQIDVAEFTQYGSDFSVNDLQQNGSTTGRLVGLDVAQSGEIFARYTNGESRVLGIVALASFNDTQGLAPVGDTAWVETFKSGNPVIGAPGTAQLGGIRASALEESNVDLSQELVGLILAQRNYQANAKTIETANAITQTIINLR